MGRRVTEKKFLVKLEPKNGNICALFDRVSEQIHDYIKSKKYSKKYYTFDEIRCGSKGAMIITLESAEKHEDELREILDKLKEENEQERANTAEETPKEYLKSFKMIAFENLLNDKLMDLVRVAEKLDDTKLDSLIQAAKK